VSPLIVEEVNTVDALRALEPEWRRLEQETAVSLPFFTFDWAVSWWAHFRESRATVRDSLFVRAIRTRAGKLVAVAPLMLTERPAVGPLRVRYVQFFGSDPNITELKGVLAAPGHEAAAHKALQQHLTSSRHRWDWLQWGGILAGSATENVLHASAALEWQRDVENFVLPLPATWDALRASLKRNIKESLRKCYNSLKRDGHVATFEVVREREQVAAALQHFFRLHAARANVTGTVQHKDVFSSRVGRAFLVDICERYAARDQARIFLLKVGEQVVATRVGFAFGRSLYLYYSGYDPAWGKYSVMTTAMAEAIRYAIAKGFAEVNLSTGNDVSKTRWGPKSRVYREALQRSGLPRGNVALKAYRYALKARENKTLKNLAGHFLARRSE
jgi:CelD/BcsL family acetyltransferase involved in cellulose biosynthesis